MDAAVRATEYLADPGAATWALVELIEAAAHERMRQDAVDAHRRLAAMLDASGTDWALGVGARCGAQLADGHAADELYRESIERLGRTGLRVELARAHLLYGEWLHHERRRSEARATCIRPSPCSRTWAWTRSPTRQAELRATGRARARPRQDGAELTAQEAQIARMARDGSNPEIGAGLLISARTVSTTCARCSRSSASPRATSSTASYLTTHRPIDRPTKFLANPHSRHLVGDAAPPPTSDRLQRRADHCRAGHRP